MITCPTLSGPITDVKIDGESMEVVSGFPNKAVVSGILHSVDRGYVEVSTAEAKNTTASAFVDLILYDTMRFYPKPLGTKAIMKNEGKTVFRPDASVDAIAFL